MAPILIYSFQDSVRLTYVLDYVFKERLKVPYTLTNDLSVYESFEGPKLSYATAPTESGLYIKSVSLLFETHINLHLQLSIHRWKKVFVLFYNQPQASLPFDVFAAIFWMLSRYEEYVERSRDVHNRYTCKQSVAYKYSFHQVPVVDYWIEHFRRILNHQFGMTIAASKASSLVTVDVDMLYQYKYKPASLQLLGGIKDLLSMRWTRLAERLSVISGKKSDPFYCFDEIQAATSSLGIPLHYFVLTLQHRTKYDRNMLISHPAFVASVNVLKDATDIGIHPSYNSLNDEVQLSQERNALEKVVNQKMYTNRFHFIKLHLPNSYHRLIQEGIAADYSMGWADENGFRAGTSRPFMWYDLENEKPTRLRVVPFCFMDATSLFYKKQTVKDVALILQSLQVHIERTGGLMTTIWHNYILGDRRQYPGWMKVFNLALSQLPK